MKHKVKLTVIDKKLYPELQSEHCLNPQSGACPCYNVGDEFVFFRDGDRDDFWRFEYAYQNKRQSRYGSGRSENAVLLGIVGRRFAIHIYRAARRLHHERLDERGKYHDCLLLGRNPSRYFQNRKNRL